MPKKATAPKRAYQLADPITSGIELCDNFSHRWILDSLIGKGGFGCLYTASPKSVGNQKNFVIKIEPEQNGPLYAEIHFYLRVCKEELLNEWKKQRSLTFLGIPRFVGMGRFKTPKGQNCRFLVMDRFQGSFEDCLLGREFSPTQIPIVALQALNALEFVHAKGYAHADIKASNLLRKPGNDEFYLADFGMATLFSVNGQHKPEKPSPKLKDNGTIEFCSRDAHAGLSPSRRSDLESLAFNLIHWLYRSQTSSPQGPSVGLPWDQFLSDPKVRIKVPESIRNKVVQAKEESMRDTKEFANIAGLGKLPVLEKFLRSIAELNYSKEPDYVHFKDLLHALSRSLSSATESASKQAAVATKRTSHAISKKSAVESSVPPKNFSPLKKMIRTNGVSAVRSSRSVHSEKESGGPASAWSRCGSPRDTNKIAKPLCLKSPSPSAATRVNKTFQPRASPVSKRMAIKPRSSLRSTVSPLARTRRNNAPLSDGSRKPMATVSSQTSPHLLSAAKAEAALRMRHC